MFAVHLWSKIVLDWEKFTEDAVKLGLDRIDTNLVNAKELGVRSNRLTFRA